jgi:hypothetical protein
LRLHDASALFEAQALRRRHDLRAAIERVSRRLPHRHQAGADARRLAAIWRALQR